VIDAVVIVGTHLAVTLAAISSTVIALGAALSAQ
jgi:hypothetical protein